MLLPRGWRQDSAEQDDGEFGHVGGARQFQAGLGIHGPVAYGASFLLDFGSALMNTTGTTHISSATSHARRGGPVSIFATGLLVGQAIGPTLGGLLGRAGDWRVAVAVAGALAFALILMASGGGPPARTGRAMEPNALMGAGGPEIRL